MEESDEDIEDTSGALTPRDGAKPADVEDGPSTSTDAETASLLRQFKQNVTALRKRLESTSEAAFEKRLQAERDTMNVQMSEERAVWEEKEAVSKRQMEEVNTELQEHRKRLASVLQERVHEQMRLDVERQAETQRSREAENRAAAAQEKLAQVQEELTRERANNHHLKDSLERLRQEKQSNPGGEILASLVSTLQGQVVDLQSTVQELKAEKKTLTEELTLSRSREQQVQEQLATVKETLQVAVQSKLDLIRTVSLEMERMRKDHYRY